MWHYYLMLSLRSLKRSPTLYSMVILTLAIGVGALASNMALYQSMAADPIPEKSDRLFHVSLNSWPDEDSPHQQPLFVTRYRDAQQVLSSGIPTKVVAHYQTRVYTKSLDAKSLTRFAADTRATTPDFFALTNAPFAYGRSLSSAEGNEVVLGSDLNDKIFGGSNSVGKAVEIEGKPYTVVGVLKPWTLRPRFYHMEQDSAFRPTDDLFVPLETAIDNNWGVNGRSSSVDYSGDMASSRPHNRFYLSLWAQLDSAAQQDSFQQYLDNYSQQLKDAGEHPLAINNELKNVHEWADKLKVVDQRLLAFSIATMLFLIVCVFNASSLLLAKYHDDKSEMGLRRALGASRNQLFRQGFVEAMLVGSIAGSLALLLSWLFLACSVVLLPNLKAIAQLEPAVLGQGFAIALLTALLSTGYPLWRANRASISAEMK
ncbi:ABC transporter permease [Neiella holothuriorum]|nr:ABC transporter permease [Neiella holothuriorum]